MAENSRLDSKFQGQYTDIPVGEAPDASSIEGPVGGGAKVNRIDRSGSPVSYDAPKGYDSFGKGADTLGIPPGR